MHGPSPPGYGLFWESYCDRFTNNVSCLFKPDFTIWQFCIQSICRYLSPPWVIDIAAIISESVLFDLMNEIINQRRYENIAEYQENITLSIS